MLLLSRLPIRVKSIILVCIYVFCISYAIYMYSFMHVKRSKDGYKEENVQEIQKTGENTEGR